MVHPSLTVAIVNLNAGRDLPLTIESILGQSYGSIQLVVFDGHSFDESYDILKRYRSSIHIFHRVEDSGIYDAMNRAAQVADGDYILFLNAGDRFYGEDSVEACMDRIGDNPDIFYGDHVYVDGRIEKHIKSAHFDILRRQLHNGQINHAWHGQIPGHQATFTRTTMLRDMPYDIRYTICADHDFLFRAHAAGAHMQYIDDIVCHYMAGGMSANQGTIIHREWAHAYRKYSLRPLDIDKFFFQTDAESPFPTFTDYSGKILKGIRKEIPEVAKGNRYILVDDLLLRSPTTTETIGLHLEGSVEKVGKKITYISDGSILGADIIQTHSFDFYSAFIKPVEPNKVIEMIIDDDDKIITQSKLIFNRLYFIDSYKTHGNAINVASLNSSIRDQIFVDGWIMADDDHEHIWSHTDQPSIAFAADRDISDLSFSFTRDDGDHHMSVSVILNGFMVREIEIDPETISGDFTINVGHIWKPGANIIRLCIAKKSRKILYNKSFHFGIGSIYWD